MKYVYNIYSIDMKFVFEGFKDFNSIEELKAYVEKDGDENYKIYSIDDNGEYTEIETVRNLLG